MVQSSVLFGGEGCTDQLAAIYGIKEGQVAMTKKN